MLRDQLTFDTYESVSRSFAKYPSSPLPFYPALKLCGEAGEVAEKIGKTIRDDNGQLSDQTREAILLELGDVLWYVAALSHDLGSSLEQVAVMNLHKLRGRAARGVIGGSGDTR